MKTKYLFVLSVVVLGSLLTALSCGTKQSARPAKDGPRLAVYIVVDQMIIDYLVRFDPLYTGGLRRLIDRSTHFDSTFHEHSATETGPGHATLGTGRYPSAHGIIANGWFDRAGRSDIYCFKDATVSLVGPAGTTGEGRSPANFFTNGICDWFRAASPERKAFSIAVKDRAAIGMGGKRPSGVFWYDRNSGNYVTSSYYADSLPGWLTSWNARRAIDTLKNKKWEKSYPDSTYALSRADQFESEGDSVFSDTFPHALAYDSTKPVDYYKKRIYASPFADEYLLSLGEELIARERLGEDGESDILCIGLSAADVIGHIWGPYSQEVQDYYLRLDKALGRFFDALDKAIGVDKYIVALSSDHGILPLPEYLDELGQTGGRILTEQASGDFDTIKEKLFAAGLADSTQIFGYIAEWYFAPGQDRPFDAKAVTDFIGAELRKLPYVVDIYTRWDMQTSGGEMRPYLARYRNNFHADRSADISVRCTERYLVGVGTQGTTHGSPYDYDAHVPFLLAGPGITPAHSMERKQTIDIPVTLASLMGVATPPDVQGQVVLTRTPKAEAPAH